MTPLDVYNIALTMLSKEDVVELFYMLKENDFVKKVTNQKIKTKFSTSSPQFELEDGIKYLLDNVFNRIKGN